MTEVVKQCMLFSHCLLVNQLAALTAPHSVNWFFCFYCNSIIIIWTAAFDSNRCMHKQHTKLDTIGQNLECPIPKRNKQKKSTVIEPNMCSKSVFNKPRPFTFFSSGQYRLELARHHRRKRVMLMMVIPKRKKKQPTEKNYPN